MHVCLRPSPAHPPLAPCAATRPASPRPNVEAESNLPVMPSGARFCLCVEAGAGIVGRAKSQTKAPHAAPWRTPPQALACIC